MATRLEIAHGLIAERDRSSTSGDTVSVTHPTTGSKTRTKGILFLVVSSGPAGPRAHEATALVAETVRHEYYYDESAGVPVCLEKAIRSADRRLRTSREGAGLPAGSIGVGAAVVRNDEVYLATAGGVEAYLARGARLLMPERSAPGGLPSDDGRPIEVWRGELSLGDAVLLVSRNVTETVGTEELKSAVLTLHPQAAAQHVHHLFVAAGGEGSDGLVVIEARELTTRTRRGVGPSALPGAYGDLPATPAGGGAALTMSRRGSLGASVEALLDRAWDTLPRRQPRPHQLQPSTSRAESQRRAALGALALVVVVFLVGLFVIIVPRGGDTTPLPQVAGADAALAVALDRTERADNLAATEPASALEYYREAWTEISAARQSGLSAPALDELEARVRAGLDGLYGAHTLVPELITELPRDADPIDLVRDSRNGALYIDRDLSGVVRVNPGNGKSTEVVLEGDKPAAGGNTRIGQPAQLDSGGPDVVITDDKGRPWRWRPANSAGAGTLNRLTLQGSPTFGEDHGDVATYSPSTGGYRLYVAEPSQNQIMRYQQTLDGSAFAEPSGYLATPSSEVADFGQLYVDFDVYTLIDNGVRRYRTEKYDGAFMLDDPPDAADLRPGHDYQRMGGSGTATSGGRLYLWDAVHGRIVGYDKGDGSYLGQWMPAADQPAMDDLRGMYVVSGKVTKKRRQADTLVWLTPEGIYRATLSLG